MCEVVLAQLSARGWEWYVPIVDDDSLDGTCEIVAAAAERNPWIGVLWWTGKDGLGVAYRDGFRRALGEGVDAVCQMDCIIWHRPEDTSRPWCSSVLDGARRCGDRLALRAWWRPCRTGSWCIRLVLSRIGASWCRMVLGVGPVISRVASRRGCPPR